MLLNSYFQTIPRVLVVYRHKAARRLSLLHRRPAGLPHNISTNPHTRQVQHLVHEHGKHRTIHERRQNKELCEAVFGERCGGEYLRGLFGGRASAAEREGAGAGRLHVPRLHAPRAGPSAGTRHAHLRLCRQGYTLCVAHLDYVLEGEFWFMVRD